MKKKIREVAKDVKGKDVDIGIGVQKRFWQKTEPCCGISSESFGIYLCPTVWSPLIPNYWS